MKEIAVHRRGATHYCGATRPARRPQQLDSALSAAPRTQPAAPEAAGNGGPVLHESFGMAWGGRARTRGQGEGRGVRCQPRRGRRRFPGRRPAPPATAASLRADQRPPYELVRSRGHARRLRRPACARCRPRRRGVGIVV
jgi:hypothetical protein